MGWAVTDNELAEERYRAGRDDLMRDSLVMSQRNQKNQDRIQR